MSAQDEICPETNRLHCQFFVQFPTQVSLATAQKILGFGPCHMGARQKSIEACIDYCTDGPTSQKGPKRAPNGRMLQAGKPSEGPGTRTDVQAMGDKLRSGATREELALDPDYTHLIIKYPHGASVIEAAVRGRAKPRPDLRVTFCYGEANCGKSLCTGSKTLARGADLPDDPWLAKFKGDFAIGFNCQKKIIFDDFTGSVMPPTELQQLCDTTPYTVNVKNGERPCTAQDIRISSNFMPDTWWKTDVRVDRQAIATRIHEVHHHWKTREEGKYMVAVYKYPDGQDRSSLKPGDLCPLERMALDQDIFPSDRNSHARADVVKEVMY